MQNFIVNLRRHLTALKDFSFHSPLEMFRQKSSHTLQLVEKKNKNTLKKGSGCFAIFTCLTATAAVFGMGISVNISFSKYSYLS